IAAAGQLRNKGWFLLGGATLFGASLLGLSLSRWLPLSVVLLAVAGFSNTSYNALANTVLQTTTPPALRGRVLSIYFLNRGLVPLGTLFAGAMATWFGAPVAVGIMGAACTLVAIGVGFAAPTLRKIE
ncbi:MAG: MFS transporter, partial [Chloroflexi bacterium]|nr:MFS transporter [Chloroflexota bacterium]